jgi:hypothetical protein
VKQAVAQFAGGTRLADLIELQVASTQHGKAIRSQR